MIIFFKTIAQDTAIPFEVPNFNVIEPINCRYELIKHALTLFMTKLFIIIIDFLFVHVLVNAIIILQFVLNALTINVNFIHIVIDLL